MVQKEIIAEWLYTIQQKMDISWAELARRANIRAATTLSRAVDMNHSSIMSVKNLEAIAQAAGIPSILDFLLYQSCMATLHKNKVHQIKTLAQNKIDGQKILYKNTKLLTDNLENNP